MEEETHSGQRPTDQRDETAHWQERALAAERQIEGGERETAAALDHAIALFAAHVAERGLWDTINASRSRGMSGTFGGVAMRTFAVAGRTMVTLELTDGLSVTLIGRSWTEGPGAPLNRHGIALHSIEAPAPIAAYMLGAVVGAWSQIRGGTWRRHIRPDGAVTIDVVDRPRPHS